MKKLIKFLPACSLDKTPTPVMIQTLEEDSYVRYKDIKKAFCNSTPRLFVYVRGGVIQTVIADQKVEIMVLDGDVEGLEGEDIKTYKDTAKEMFNARKAWDKVEVNKKVVDHYFSQR
jgi:hypothetical protein